MEPTIEPALEHNCENDLTKESIELSERLKNATPSARKMEKGREIISRIDPVKFKELTGRDLFKK